jgi:polyhydroxyalkanoate synthesis regulator phasin
MADDKDTKAKPKKAKAKKAAATKPKKAAASKTEKAAKANSGKKQTAKKPKAKKGAGKKATSSKSRSAGMDKSFAQLRDSLEHSVTLSRERIQEVVDDAVKRGRMTHGDAEKMIGELLKRGRKQTDALLSELEKLVRQARRKLPS